MSPLSLWHHWEKFIFHLLKPVYKLFGYHESHHAYVKNRIYPGPVQKTRPLLIVGLAGLIILVPILFLTLKYQSRTEAAWYNSDWHYRKPIIIDNDGSSATNQKVKIDVNTTIDTDSNVANFDIDNLTFTPNIAKRNSIGGSSTPFSAGPLIQGKSDASDNGDTLQWANGTQIAGNFYSNFDSNQGTISFWFTPEWNGNDSLRHWLFSSRFDNSRTIEIYKESTNNLIFHVGNQSITKDASGWITGSTYLIIARWDFKNTLDGTNYLSISVNNNTTFGTTSAPSDTTFGTTITLGAQGSVTGGGPNGVIEGLTVYRRPLWDGSTGINAGNSNEVSSIFNSGAGQDPTMITGSWDVVFALPTNSSTGSLGVGGTGQAWSHPHSSNVLYTSTSNTGGFMIAGTAVTDGWTTISNGGTAPSINALSSTEKIYTGGYKIAAGVGATNNQGIGRTASSLTAGQNYVIRALANSDGTSIPKVQIWDNTNNAEITSLTGTVGSGRTAPDIIIFTFELPTTARQGVASDCTSIDIRLLNTQDSGTVYWHQIELLVNRADNPSHEVGSGTPYKATGWNNTTMTESAKSSDVHSGQYSSYLARDSGSYSWYIWSGFSYTKTINKFYGGGYFAKVINAPTVFEIDSFPTYIQWPKPSSASWKGYQHVWRQSVSGGTIRMGKAGDPPVKYYFDDMYIVQTDDVSLTVTPTSLTNSTESTGLRIDGYDTAISTVSNLTTTAGTIKFQYTPRHSAADSNKFTQSGTVNDDVYLGEWYGDSDDYIKLYWDSANTLLLKYSMAGVGGSGTYNATNGIVAGATYSMKISYTGGSNMTLGIGATSAAITLSSIPASFGAAPTTAYWGTNSSGTGQADATYAQSTGGVKQIQSDCDDVRFTDANGKLLQYYYDSTNGPCNTESTDFYVLMPTILSGDNTIFIYYGNSSAKKGSQTDQFTQATFSQDSTSISSEEQSKAPIAFWSFDEGQGSIIQDKSSNNNDGALGTGTSAPSWQTEDMCVAGKCLSFDGNDYISIDNTANDVKTVSFWIKPTTTSQNFIDFDGGTHYISDSSGVVSATGFDNPTVYVNGISNGILTANIWNHIEVTTTTSFSATNIKLGQRSTNFLTGFMDEVKLFNYARSAAEIKTDYNAGKSRSSKGTSVNLGAAKSTQGGYSSSLSEGLVGYWKMDETSWNGSANEVIDSSENSNHGVGVGNTIPTTVTGKFGNAGTFDGVSQYANLGSASSLDNLTSSQMTVSFWAKASTDAYFLSKDNGGTNGWIIANSGDDISITIREDTPTAYLQTVTNDNRFPDAAWHHVTATFNNTTDRLFHIYIDGKESTYGTQTRATKTIYSDSSFNLQAGWRGWGGYWKGSLDEVRIYNRALSPVEVRQLYEWAPGPVGHWKFDEGVGSTAYDISGKGNSGVLGTGNSAPTWATGKYGKGLKFDGSNDYVSMGNQSYLKPSTPFTISSWVKLDSLPSQPRAGIITSTGIGGNESYSGFSLGVDSTGTITTQTGNDAGFCASDYRKTFTTTTTVTTNQWYYTTVVFNSATDHQIYINGTLQPTTNSGAATTLVYSSANDFRLGYFPKPNTGCNLPNGYLDGVIDQVLVYNYARTQKQIVEDMNAGHPSVGSPVGSALAHYKFDEGYGTTVNNNGFGGSTLNGTLGTGASAPSWSNNGKFGKALSFDGTDDYINLASNIALTTDWTISFWAIPQNTSSFQGLVGANSGNYINLESDRFHYSGAGHHYTTLPVSNQWRHFVFSRDNNGLINLYLDNKRIDSYTDADTSFNIDLIGTFWDDLQYTYQGYLDELKIYNYALTEDEIKLDYNQGSTLVMGSLSSGTGNTAPSNAASQEYCIPGGADLCLPPVARWDMNEGVGTTAYDTSGNGNNGILGAGSSAPTWKTGKVGKGLNFDGSNDYVYISSFNGVNNSSSMTICAWVYLNSIGTTDNNDDSGIFNQDGTTSTLLWYNVNAAGSGNHTYSFNSGSTSDTSNRVNGSDNIAIAKKWQYVCGVMEGSTRKLFVDGILNSSVTGATSTTVTLNGTGNRIGGWDGGSNFHCDGIIDQLRIYDYARTPAQIAWDYNRGSPIGQWKMDECQGTTINDSSGNGNGGTLIVGASGSQNTVGTCSLGVGQSSAWGNGTTGRLNYSLNFDGTDDYIDLGTNPIISGSNPYSLSAWVKGGTMSAYGGVLGIGNGVSGQLAWIGWITTAQVGTSNSWGGGGYGLNIGSGITDKTNWHHIILTSSGGPTQTINVYIDGLLKQTTSASLNIASTSKKIGVLDDNGTKNYWFSGQIDDARIYNYPLTAAQVKLLFNNGAVSFGPASGVPN